MLLLTIQIEMAKPRADTKVLPFIFYFQLFNVTINTSLRESQSTALHK